MKATLILMVVLGFVPDTPAADLPKITGTMPSVVLARAALQGGTVKLTVKSPVTVCEPRTRTITVPVAKTVDGKKITELVTKDATEMVCVIKWEVREVRLGDAGVAVTDAAGKLVPQTEVLQRLEQETAILRAVGGPADIFYLQTTKPETLVLVTPSPPK